MECLISALGSSSLTLVYSNLSGLHPELHKGPFSANYLGIDIFSNPAINWYATTILPMISVLFIVASEDNHLIESTKALYIFTCLLFCLWLMGLWNSFFCTGCILTAVSLCCQSSNQFTIGRPLLVCTSPEIGIHPYKLPI